jgi:predicted Zn-dependent protease
MTDIQTSAIRPKRRSWRLLGIGVLVSLIGLVSAVILLYVQTLFYFRWGTHDLERHHNAEALKHFQAYLRIWPNDPQILLLAARASWRLQEFEQAEQYLQKLQQASGSAEEFNREALLAAAARGEIDRAMKFFQDQQQRPDAALPLILEALATGCLQQERFDEARAFLQRWLELQPDDPQALIYQIGLDRSRKSPRATIAEYRRLLQLDPDLDIAQLPLADILVETRQYEEAIPLLEGLRQRQPKNWQVLVLLARCQDYLGQQEAAEQLLDQALAQAPDQAAALAVRGQVALHKGQLTAAESWLHRALVREPGDYRVNQQLVDCLSQQGRTEEMQKQLQRFKQLVEDQKRMMILSRELELNPHDPTLLREKAMVLLRGGNVEEGLRFLSNALRQDPKSQELRQALAEYYQQMGNREQRPASIRSFAPLQEGADAQKHR